ncbi:hypothetical protein BC937DRAFT_92855 [Endogone sp. FLAS-F59071]|nr:hypothetical protein BC937DRAFT_92855 [Endogone sp. FLAS-F59071]|eukprot:RUS21383.1 hypothetical protein BC937DRAFT_92855 [Endogone sp. FLAS-F59071]
MKPDRLHDGNFLHRDVRWPNILFVPPGAQDHSDGELIDFKYAGRAVEDMQTMSLWKNVLLKSFQIKCNRITLKRTQCRKLSTAAISESVEASGRQRRTSDIQGMARQRHRVGMLPSFRCQFLTLKYYLTPSM